MRKYFIYFMIYSFLGFVLERIINVIFLGYYYDNSVMIGPYQPLYGLGILLAIIIYDFFLKHIDSKILRYFLLIIVAVLTTGFSEYIHGEGFEYFKGYALWNYGMTFSMCTYPYVCALPTTLFGVLSGLTIIFIHPFIRKIINGMPGMFFRWTFRILLVLFLLDGGYTFIVTLLEIF